MDGPHATAERIDVRIRQATAEDVALLEWKGLFWQYRGIFEHTFAEQAAGRRLMLVATHNGYPVGRLFVQLSPGVPLYSDGSTRAYLYSLRVIDRFQRQGVGSRLIAAAEDMLRAREYRWATIAAATDNPRARRLYERLGYTYFHDEPGCWSYTDPDDVTHAVVEPCWVFQKALTPQP
jgi:ribosomal protein S18 acetylase RimI-like enzyme